jgi:hypothetical protein
MWCQGRARAGQVNGPSIARYVFQSLGIVSGEGAIVSVANFHDLAPPCRIRLLDSDGKVEADSGDIRIPAQGTIHFRVPYAKLLPAVQVAGRKQFRAVVLVFPDPDSPGGYAPPCRLGVELVNTFNGHTFGIATPPDPDFIQ